MKKGRTNYNLALFLIFINVIISGGNSPLIKIALREIPSFTFNLLRFVIAFLFFIPLLIGKKIKFGKSTIGVIFLSLLLTSNIVLFNFGIQKTTANIGQMIYAATPIITSILSYFLLNEKFRSKKILGIIIGFMGTLLIILLPLLEKGSSFKGDLIGNLLIFIAMIFTAVYFVFSKTFQKEYKPLDITFYFVLVTLISQLPLAAVEFSSHQNWWASISKETLFGLLWVGSIGTVGFYFLYQSIIKHSTPLIASMMLYLQPISTFVWAAILLKEGLNTVFIIGAILTFIGVWLTTRSEKESELAQELSVEELR